MASFSMRVSGAELRFRMPTLSELTQLRKVANDEAKRIRALKDLAISCAETEDKVRDLARTKGGIYVALGNAILKACGAIGPLDVVDGDDVSETQAKTLVDCESHGVLHAVRYTPRLGEPMDLVVRQFTESEIEEYSRDSDSVATCKQLVKRILKLGQWDEIEERAPGLFIAICEFAHEMAGSAEDIELGE